MGEEPFVGENNELEMRKDFYTGSLDFQVSTRLGDLHRATILPDSFSILIAEEQSWKRTRRGREASRGWTVRANISGNLFNMESHPDR
jgi:hypothetical protein